MASAYPGGGGAGTILAEMSDEQRKILFLYFVRDWFKFARICSNLLKLVQNVACKLAQNMYHTCSVCSRTILANWPKTCSYGWSGGVWPGPSIDIGRSGGVFSVSYRLVYGRSFSVKILKIPRCWSARS